MVISKRRGRWSSSRTHRKARVSFSLRGRYRSIRARENKDVSDPEKKPDRRRRRKRKDIFKYSSADNLSIRT
jgi:hypothetical protein